MTVIERGTITDWARLASAVRNAPWGKVARQIEEYLSYEQGYGVGPLLTRAIAEARHDAEARERSYVAAEIAWKVADSGLTIADLASELGTYASRLSTNRSGKVVPCAAFLVHLRETVTRLTS